MSKKNTPTGGSQHKKHTMDVKPREITPLGSGFPKFVAPKPPKPKKD